MRLINVDTLDLEDFVGSHDTPPYAILSHTWQSREEISYLDWLQARADPVLQDRVTGRRGYAKITGAARQAKALGCAYLWVDTNCIDKSSSAELSEAINSMFTWYTRSKVCLVHLADVVAHPVPLGPGAPGPSSSGLHPGAASGPGDLPLEAGPDLEKSRWFRRGWTLQELLAPRRIIFYSADWHQVGTGSSLETRLSAITGISAHYLRKDNPLWASSVAEKLSWLAGRKTTREEDMAYCMLGIFRINMPLLYGEGSRAFLRLQEEIIRRSNDHTIFAWMRPPVDDEYLRVYRHDVPSILAASPRQFVGNTAYSIDFTSARLHNPAFAWTNAGLNIEVAIISCYRSHYMVINANLASNRRNRDQRLCVPIDGNLDRGIVGRATVAGDPVIMPADWATHYRSLFFPPSPEKWISSMRRPNMVSSHAFLLTFRDACNATGPVIISVDTRSISKMNELNLAVTNHFDPVSSLLELSPSREDSSNRDDGSIADTEDLKGHRVTLHNARRLFHESMLLITTPSSKFLVWLCMYSSSQNYIGNEKEDQVDATRMSTMVTTDNKPATMPPLEEQDEQMATAFYVFRSVSVDTPPSIMRDTWLLEKRAFLSARRHKWNRNYKELSVERGPATSIEGIRTLVPLHLHIKQESDDLVNEDDEFLQAYRDDETLDARDV